MRPFLAFLPSTIIPLVLLMLTACGTIVPLQRSEVANINRDMSAAELDKILPKNKVVFEYELPANDQHYRVRHANLKTGQIQQAVYVCSPTCVTLFVPVTTTTQYVVIQEAPEGKVFAFGTLEELGNDTDNSIRSIIPAIRQTYREKILQRQAEARDKLPPPKER